MLLSSIRTNSLGLGLFAILTAAAIALTQVWTAPRIEANRTAAATRALDEIIPPSAHDEPFFAYPLPIAAGSLGYEQETTAYQARLQGKVEAVILPVSAPDGYSGAIELVVGIWADGRLAGVRVLQHKETPGLGDKIETRKSDWIHSFAGLSLTAVPEQAWAVKKDGGQFDQFTGATITPRAIVHAVERALQYFNHQRAKLLSAEASKDG
ncbi:electron transport complex subunit RsxG [Balneatrix alpica]|uniref:electron transport complex subunit RsxG n=1 Tax=Balneatrix alpica TaxID=75684 RepID=UPI00273A5540|nr:electron transport complex subunit RsxG [Balneatrix alpica]